MGTSYEDAPGHEGYIAQIWDDGSVHAGGAQVDEARIVAFCAACSHGGWGGDLWYGATVVDRYEGDDAWPEWSDLPELEAEWLEHLAPFQAAFNREVTITIALPGPTWRAVLDAVGDAGEEIESGRASVFGHDEDTVIAGLDAVGTAIRAALDERSGR